MKKQKIYTPEEKQLILAQGIERGGDYLPRARCFHLLILHLAAQTQGAWSRRLVASSPGRDDPPRRDRSAGTGQCLTQKLLAEKEMELSLAKELIKKKFSPVRK